MKFLCIECDEQMSFDERSVPGDGTFAASFKCPECGRRVAMLANPMESQLVNSLGVEIGGSTLDEHEPLQMARTHIQGDVKKTGGVKAPVAPTWSDESKQRLERVPSFVRGMVKKIYAEYARERGITEITVEVMDRARTDLGLEGM